MIQAVKLNQPVSFKGNSEGEQKKAGIKDFAKASKDVALNTLKGMNNVANTSQGALRGAAEGSLAAATIALLGKNIKEHDRDVWKSLSGIGKDIGQAVVKTVKFVPSLVTKSPIDNIKTVAKTPGKFYTNYLKGHKAAAAVATIIGVGILAFRTIQGKMNANLNNANIDHRTNRGHIDN